MKSLRSLLRRRKPGTEDATFEKIDAAFTAGDFSTGIALARTLAERGDARAAYRLGEVFEHGIGALQDYAQAVEWYERAASADIPDAWSKLGDIYLTGRGTWHTPEQGAQRSAAQSIVASLSVEPDHFRAGQFNQKAAAAGQIDAQTRLGLQYQYGLGFDKDIEAAARHLTAAAQAGHALAQRAIGSVCLERGTPDSLVEAAAWFRKAAEQGDAHAQAQLAAMILNHQTPGEDEEAVALLQPSAEAGDVLAMTILGDLHKRGRGAPKDLSAAESWFRRAAVRGYVAAGNALGRLLIEDIEPNDYVSAAHAFRETADKGDAFGQFMLGRLLLTGKGVPPDRDKAVGYLRKAADQGHLQAIELLAAIHDGHGGADPVPEVAAELFEQAAEKGSVDALYHRARIALANEMVADGMPIIAMLEEAANRGSGAACLQLGSLYAQGELIVQDYAAAAHWYREASDRGLPEGLINLAFLQLHGHDPEPEEPAGLALLKDLANDGNQRAMWALSNIYREGALVEPDWWESIHWLKAAAKAGNGAAACMLVDLLDAPTDRAPSGAPEIIEWLRHTAELGDAQSQSVLGRMLYQGRHVKQDFNEAFRLIHKAAEAGVPFAQAWMGDVLASGEGVMKDMNLAQAWYSRAAANGHQGAVAVLRHIESADKV